MNLPGSRPRPKKILSPEEDAERLERKRASQRERNKRYYARLRAEKAERQAARAQHYVTVCRHDCGCGAEIIQPVCGLCERGLCDE